MASISIYSAQDGLPVIVARYSGGIRIKVGAQWLTVSREEAAQLAVDLLNAVEATPVDVGVAA